MAVLTADFVANMMLVLLAFILGVAPKKRRQAQRTCWRAAVIGFDAHRYSYNTADWAGKIYCIM